MFDYYYFPFGPLAGARAELVQWLGDTIPQIQAAQGFLSPIDNEGAIIDANGQSHRDFTGVQNNQSLCVIGHAARAMSVLASGHGRQIDQTALVEKLRLNGLNPGTHVRLHLWACYSGSGKGCLAEKVAHSMDNTQFRGNNDTNIRVIGYPEKVSTRPHRDANGVGRLSLQFNGDWTPMDEECLSYIAVQYTPGNPPKRHFGL